MYHCKSYEIVLLYKASFLLREFCGIKILIHNSGAKLKKITNFYMNIK